MALIVEPEAPLGDWFAALDRHLQRAAVFFADRPVVADLARIVGGETAQGLVVEALDELARRNLRVIGVEGAEPSLLAKTRWGHLPTVLHGALREETDAGESQADGPQALLVERPVRSGESIYFEAGDVTVVGSVASGAEVIAGGSIHVYGALRGRAIAGLKTGDAARIFCRRLDAELLAVNGVYRTAEDWGESLRDSAVQAWCDRGMLRVLALD
ncbi:septum site-determining protein MinC [Phenylobacterium montanum]|uniref:Probable septum site-determining protein MinC n=2 Tax=Phenylobacterium montanum TaxID=2823693 RepID=A0A975G5V9_9CAUL|nr:septum site-determining protein MinC [Caulobacter sp. S6]